MMKTVMSKFKTSLLVTVITLFVAAITSLVFILGFSADGAKPADISAGMSAEAGSLNGTSDNHTSAHTGYTVLTSSDTTLSSGKYYLNDNVSMSGITVTGNVTLCLNGKTFTGNGNGTPIAINEGKTLTLCDCCDTGTITRTITTNSIFDVFGTLNMYGGKITGSFASSGAGVWIDSGGAFNMYGGKISDNTAERGGCNGGGVYVKNGTFTMYGGEISGNTATNGGGGVFVDGTNSTFTMNGGTISDNTATTNGGGVYINGGATFAMSGGKISDNSATTNGGGVYINDGGTFKVSGSAKIIRNKKGSTVNNVVFLNANQSITVSGKLTDALIGVTPSSLTHVVTSGYGDNNKTESGAAIDPSKYFFGDDGKTAILTSKEVVFDVTSIVAKVTLEDGTTSNHYSIEDAFEHATGTATIMLWTEGVTASAVLAISGGEVTLDLNGKTLNLNARHIEVTGGTLTIDDQSDNGGGKITGGYAELGGGVYVNGATFTMLNGTICDNKAQSGGGVLVVGEDAEFIMTCGTIIGNEANNGGGVYTSTRGTFTMSDGTISDNTAEAVGGGGVYVYASTFDMNGGSITGNKATGTATESYDYLGAGGGVFVASGGAFNISGGEISDNTTNTAGGGVYVYKTATRVSVSGEVKITENTKDGAANNVYLAKDRKITVTGALKDDDGNCAKIGVTLADDYEGVFTDGYGLNNSGVAPSTYFTADDENYAVALDNGEVKLGNAVASVKIGNITTKYTTIGEAFTAADGKTATITLLEWGMAYDVLTISSGDVTLDLSGNTLDLNGHNIQITGGTFTLIDGETGGTITYGHAGQGGAVNVSADATFTMESGTITENTATNGGGGVRVLGTFIMNGGTIAGNDGGQWGGGVFVSGTFTMNDGTIGGDTAADKNTASEVGGGVCVGTDGTFKMNGGKIINNSATTSGGGVSISENGEFEMTAGTIINNTTTTSGGGVYAYLGKFKMTGGTVSGNNSDTYGGGVCFSSSEFTMEGGTISGNESDNGGGVCIYNSNFTMTGGTIKGNTATNGGGVFVRSGSEFTMKGGTIGGTTEADKNTTTDGGAGVWVDANGKFTMEGGEISGNESDNGGGVYVNGGMISTGVGTFTMKDTAKISNNTATGNGGGVYIVYGGTFTMENGTISDNAATDGGGVCVPSGMIINNGDYVFASAYFYMTGGTISDNTATNKGGGVYVGSNGYSVSGSAKVFRNKVGSNVHNVYTYRINVTGALTDALIGITYESTDRVFTSGYGANNKNGDVVADPSRYFFLDTKVGDVAKTAKLNESNEVIFDANIYVASVTIGSDTSYHKTIKEAFDEAEGNEATITLLKSVTAYETLTLVGGDDITFDLNGNVLNLNAKNIALAENCLFTLIDGDDNTNNNNGGKIVGGNGNWGGAVDVEDSSFIMYNGTICNNKAHAGGGVYVEATSAFNMYGGAITDNEAFVGGGGVCVYGNFTMSGGTISGNTATLIGGAVSFENGKFTMTGGTISGNEASHGGGVYILEAEFTMSGGEISDNKAKFGGGLYVSGSDEYEAKCTITGGEINGNEATEQGGGAVFYACQVILSVTEESNGGEISGNKARFGGGVQAERCTFTMSGCTISGNTATEHGGGIDIIDSSFTMTGGAIKNNIAGTEGGGLSGYFEFYIGGKAVIIDNTADGSDNNVYLPSYISINVTEPLTNGAQIGVTLADDYTGAFTNGYKTNNGTASPAKFFFDDSDENKAMLSGDEVIFGVPVASVDVGDEWYFATIENAFTFANGKTATVTLIADEVTASAVLTISGGEVTLDLDGKTLNLSGYNIQVTGGKFTLVDGEDNTANNGGLITGGNATGGGGVCVNGENTEFVMENGTITGNASGEFDYGGGVYVELGTFTMTGGTITGNTAGAGGGVGVDGGTFTMTGGTISDNTGLEAAGGVYVTNSTFNMSGGTISGNTATEHGGGVFVEGTFNMSGGTITGNTATSKGGGVYVYDGEFTMTGGTIGGTDEADANAAERGGGVYVEAGGTFTMAAGTVEGDNGETVTTFGTISGNTSQFGGGGVYVVGEFNMTGGTISGNTSQFGGGVYVYDNGTFNMTDGTIGGTADDANTAASGGGVYVDSNGTFNMTGGTISGNTATEHGGGVYVGGDFNMDGGEISGNTANRGNGGGVYVYYGTFTMSKAESGTVGTISGNTANRGNGGGVYVGGGEFKMTDGTIGGTADDANTASQGGGVYVDSNGTFNMTGGTISGNSANSGGGVYISYGMFNMSKAESGTVGTISGNEAVLDGGGVYVYYGYFTMNDGTISGNEAIYSGCGGVYVYHGEFTMNGGAISRNKDTSTNGYGCGGVYVNGGEFTMNDGTISGNEVQYGSGGGVYVYYGGIFIMKDGTITGNNAGYSGGGVYVYDGSFELYGGKITGNTVTAVNGEKPGNVYLRENDLIYIYEALKDGTKVGITVPSGNTDYVFTTTGYGTNNTADGQIIAPKTFFFGDGGECVRVADDGAVVAGHHLTKFEAKPADCTTDGNKEYWHCSECGKNYADADATELMADTVIAAGHHMIGHAASDADCENDGNIAYQYCDKCNKYFSSTKVNGEYKELFDAYTVDNSDGFKIKAFGHSYRQDETKTNDPATCTDPGTKYLACSVCGNKSSESIPATGHDTVHYTRKEATCTEPGNIEYWSCNKCGLNFSDEVCTKAEADVTIATNGSHDYSGVPPTWVWTGYTSAVATFTCQREGCGHTETETALATPTAEKPDNKITSVEVKATCGAAGKRTYTAYVKFNGADYFNTNATDEVLPKLDHVWTPTWVWTEDASHNVSVKVIFACNRNGETAHTEEITEGIDIDDSDRVNPTCSVAGTITYSASVVYEGETYTTTKNNEKHVVAIAATGEHTYKGGDSPTDSDYTVYQQPTCTAAGFEARYCTQGCGLSIDTRIVAALGHDWRATKTDGTTKTYNAFQTFNLSGFTATFVCAHDGCFETYDFADAASKPITYATGNCLHVGDTSVSVTIDLPNNDTYTYEFTGITVNPIAATDVAWEYSSDNGATWKPLADNLSLPYDGKEYTVRVSFAKDGADDNTAVTDKYVKVFDEKFSNVKDGGYTYTLAALGDYTIADSSRKVTVTKKQVTAGGDKWIGGGANLMDGAVKKVGDNYRYFPAGTDGATDVANAVVRYLSGSVSVSYPDGTLYTVSYTEDSVTSATASGMYTAVAILTLPNTDNYEFVLADGVDEDNVKIVDSKITVTKVWYAALCDNGFVSTIADWKFGATDVLTALPELEKGQGTAAIKLTLTRGDELIGVADFAPADFTDYINSTTPVGSYTLTAKVGKVTIDSFEYAAFMYDFKFKVNEADAFTVGNLSALKDISTNYDGTLHIYNSFTPDVSGLITAGTGVWAGNDYKKYYGSAAISYSHSTLSEHYFTYAELLAQTKSTLFINASDTAYVALFRIAAPNYTEVTGSFNVTINKAIFDLKEVEFSDKTVEYKKDTWHSLGDITGLPTETNTGLTADGIIKVTYDGNRKQVAKEDGHVVTATLTLSDTTNYKFINSDGDTNGNISSDGTTAEYTALLKIMKATYNIDVTFNDDNVEYNGQSHKLEVVWNHKPDGVTVTYDQNNLVNANEDGYTITAIFHGDYNNYNAIPNKTATLIIRKAIVDLSQIELPSLTCQYDGYPHSLIMSGKPDQVEVAYDVANVTDQGTHLVTATLSLKSDYAGNYKFADDAVLTYSSFIEITAFKFDMTEVKFEGKTVEYTGNAYSLYISGTLPGGVTYSYEGNNCVEVGTHTVKVHFYHNRGSNFADIEDMTAELIIEQAEYDLSGVTFPDATFTYNGNPHSLSIRGTLPAGVTYSYDEYNSLTEVGSRLVTVYFHGDSKNYKPIPEMHATLKVAPASVGITNVSLESKTLKYDGKTHNLAVNGNLPDGVTVKYYYVNEAGEEVEFNGAMDEGTYNVVAKFELPSENFKAIRPLNATLTIVKSDTPVKPPVVVEPSVDTIDTPAAIVDSDLDVQAPVVMAEIKPEEEFPYWAVAVAIIGAEVLAMAIMGGYMAFRKPGKKKK